MRYKHIPWSASAYFRPDADNSNSLLNFENDRVVEIYPNPVNDYLFIKNIEKSKIVKLELMNISGQIIKTFNYEEFDFNNEIMKLDMKALISGMYLIRIKTINHSIYNIKFVKQ